MKKNIVLGVLIVVALFFFIRSYSSYVSSTSTVSSSSSVSTPPPVMVQISCPNNPPFPVVNFTPFQLIPQLSQLQIAYNSIPNNLLSSAGITVPSDLFTLIKTALTTESSTTSMAAKKVAINDMYNSVISLYTAITSKITKTGLTCKVPSNIMVSMSSLLPMISKNGSLYNFFSLTSAINRVSSLR